jgi:cytochrome c peroxidase
MLRFLVALFVIPLGLDLYLPVPEGNPITKEKVALGRKLFFDRRLSRDGSVSCATCHDPKRAFSTPLSLSSGVGGRQGRRNAPTLVNRGYGRAFFWDGRMPSLEEQVLKPIQDPNEMDLTLEEASARVKLDVLVMSRALASYVRSILSGGSPYDRFINGRSGALSVQQKMGLEVFRGKGNCTACHVGPTFTDEHFHNTGVAWRDARFADEGRFAISKDPRDHGAFKTPTLREVALTGPYMHDGSMATLEQVIEFYSDGGRTNPLLDSEIRPRNFSAEEKLALTEFLIALSGRVYEGFHH